MLASYGVRYVCNYPGCDKTFADPSGLSHHSDSHTHSLECGQSAMESPTPTPEPVRVPSGPPSLPTSPQTTPSSSTGGATNNYPGAAVSCAYRWSIDHASNNTHHAGGFFSRAPHGHSQAQEACSCQACTDARQQIAAFYGMQHVFSDPGSRRLPSVPLVIPPRNPESLPLNLRMFT